MSKESNTFYCITLLGDILICNNKMRCIIEEKEKFDLGLIELLSKITDGLNCYYSELDRLIKRKDIKFIKNTIISIYEATTKFQDLLKEFYNKLNTKNRRKFNKIFTDLEISIFAIRLYIEILININNSFNIFDTEE